MKNRYTDIDIYIYIIYIYIYIIYIYKYIYILTKLTEKQIYIDKYSNIAKYTLTKLLERREIFALFINFVFFYSYSLRNVQQSAQQALG